MNGILNVLKPAGMTSFDVIAVVRRITHQKKIGHTGTLDPSAVGVLPICFGNATKAIEFMIDKDKVYRAELTLGISTDTQDSSGRVNSYNKVNASNNEIVDVCQSFKGEIMQMPPMYSAIKIGGKKLYEIARQGETIEREARKITIFDINILKIWDENVSLGDEKTQYDIKKVIFDVHCSKGTYIRTLCNDIGERLGCGGHMSFLIRTRAGKYDIQSSLTLEEINALEESDALNSKLIPVESVFNELGSIKLNETDTIKYNNGVWIKDIFVNDNQIAIKRVYDNNGIFLGIGEIFNDKGNMFLKSRKFFRDV